MSKYIKKKGLIELHYGWDDSKKEYYYYVYDFSRKNINNGLIEFAGSKSTTFCEYSSTFEELISKVQLLLLLYNRFLL